MTMCCNMQVLRYWPFGDPWCRIWLAVDVWMCTASIYNLVAISIDRYIAVSRPIRYATLMSPTRAKLLIISVWILSFVICFPPLIGWDGGHTAKFSATIDTRYNRTEHLNQSSPTSKGLLFRDVGHSSEQEELCYFWLFGAANYPEGIVRREYPDGMHASVVSSRHMWDRKKPTFHFKAFLKFLVFFRTKYF